jgi:hypothetical protein
MASVLEMAEAHLLNVQREINSLLERRSVIENDINRLTSYLKEGQAILLEEKGALSQQRNVGGTTVFNPNLGL